MSPSRGWIVSVRRTTDGYPLRYIKEYPGKGFGNLTDRLSGSFYWQVGLEFEEDGEVIPFDGGYVGSLREGKVLVDNYFDMVDEYE